MAEYSAEFRARAVEELALLPEGSAIVEMLGDYAVMREQVRHCARADFSFQSLTVAHLVGPRLRHP